MARMLIRRINSIVHLTLFVLLVALLGPSSGCRHAPDQSAPLQITLDWKPEPEFGGFYQADISGAFQKRGLNVQLKTAGAGAPTWQLVASGQTAFATTAADQVLIARARGADIVAVFAVYQTFPQGVMAHQARGFNSIADVFSHEGTLAAEDDTWLKYLVKKYQPIKVQVTGYAGGVAGFLAKTDMSQQCFVTSEPLLAKRQGGDPQTFLVADAGYNPYTTVLITSGKTWRETPDKVKLIVEACRQGWREYLDDPTVANAAMAKLNTEMDADTFKQAAAAQKPLIETDDTKTRGLGAMSSDRWEKLGQQLLDLKVIDRAPAPAECFVNPLDTH
ncbi:MAG TPA: ABC transporter substrate-binding protein [Tepidisphaeraceae bacterium]|jgi:NitT/TauT family transport system substrate-binding protein